VFRVFRGLSIVWLFHSKTVFGQNTRLTTVAGKPVKNFLKKVNGFALKVSGYAPKGKASWVKVTLPKFKLTVVCP
jgi:hypothetical protein